KQAAQLPSLPEGNNYPCAAINRSDIYFQYNFMDRNRMKIIFSYNETSTPEIKPDGKTSN
ncbi:MAG: hypothetical protein KAU83_12145, partial [Bacteroidales bacterium]|nr:hypothetical protein [Bacteroidales bacterium]